MKVTVKIEGVQIEYGRRSIMLVAREWEPDDSDEGTIEAFRVAVAVADAVRRVCPPAEAEPVSLAEVADRA